METTIIYYTDGSFNGELAGLVRKHIANAGLPIISVSQEPMDFGTNVCIGKIGRSYKSIQSQVLVGALCAKTKYVALAEHDTFYPDGYFNWTPPRDDTFYYNKNRVSAVAKKGPQYGMYLPFEDAHPNADQLICNRRILIQATIERIHLLDLGKPLPVGWCEPGFNWPNEKFQWRWTDIPSVDIFHNNNFTARHGCFEEIVWEVEGWGKFKDIK